MPFRNRFVPAVLVLVALLLPSTRLGAQDADHPVAVSAGAPARVKPGDRFDVTVDFTILAHHHIYGPKETEGTPTTVKLEPAPGFTVGEAVFPEPAKAEMYGQTYAVYSDKLTVKIPVTATAEVRPGTMRLKALVSWAACTEQYCLEPIKDQPVEVSVQVVAADGGTGITAEPAKKEYAARAKLTGPTGPVKPGERFDLLVEFTIDDGYHIYGAKTATGFATKVEPVATAGFAFESPVFPPTQELVQADEKAAVYEHAAVVRIPVVVAADAQAGEYTLAAKVHFAACDADRCFPPQRNKMLDVRVQVVASPAGNGGSTQPPANDPPKAEPAPDAGAGTAGDSVADQDYAKEVERRGLFLAILFGFGMGLVASLTPCVFPMIPVTISYFSSQAGGSRAKALSMASVYVGGIVLTYAIFGLLAGRAGKDIGAYSANPWVVGVLVAVFLALALSMFGLYEIRLPSSLTTRLESAGSERGGYLGAFILGLVLGFVAAPCVGPFAGSLLVWAATQPPLIALIALATFGLGMGVPFLVLAVFSNWLIRPGMWMVKVKISCGFFLLVMAVYFMKPLVPKYLPDWPLLLSAGVLTLAWASFVGAFTAAPADAGVGSRMLKTLAVLLALVGAFFLLGGLNRVVPLFSHTGATAETEHVAWVTDFEKGMARAIAEKKPVYMDFTADW